MNTDKRRWDENEITEKIIGSAFTVSNTLGIGFLEKVYENALRHEITKQGLLVQQQVPIKIGYDGVVVGDYIADLLVESHVLVELKVAKALDDIHLAQCLNYLKGTGLKLALLINFGNTRVEVKRVRND
ncbi:MAG: GxxExxY protein [Lacipirellulaceae bacterium]